MSRKNELRLLKKEIYELNEKWKSNLFPKGLNARWQSGLITRGLFMSDFFVHCVIYAKNVKAILKIIDEKENALNSYINQIKAKRILKSLRNKIVNEEKEIFDNWFYRLKKSIHYLFDENALKHPGMAVEQAQKNLDLCGLLITRADKKTQARFKTLKKIVVKYESELLDIVNPASRFLFKSEDQKLSIKSVEETKENPQAYSFPIENAGKIDENHFDALIRFFEEFQSPLPNPINVKPFFEVKYDRKISIKSLKKSLKKIVSKTPREWKITYDSKLTTEATQKLSRHKTIHYTIDSKGIAVTQHGSLAEDELRKVFESTVKIYTESTRRKKITVVIPNRDHHKLFERICEENELKEVKIYVSMEEIELNKIKKPPTPPAPPNSLLPVVKNSNPGMPTADSLQRA